MCEAVERIAERNKAEGRVEGRRETMFATAKRMLESGMLTLKDIAKFSGYNVPDKFERTGLKAVKSKYVDAPVIVGSPVVIECELIEFVETENFSAVLARVVNMAADESVLDENGKIDTGKIGMIFYESFSNGYYRLGEKVGKAWSEGKVFME